MTLYSSNQKKKKKGNIKYISLVSPKYWDKYTLHSSEKKNCSETPANAAIAATAILACMRLPSRHTLSKTGYISLQKAKTLWLRQLKTQLKQKQ